jgi:acetylornithine deacetylase/succinyl-diaminopimelate desuccinylase-like protein
MSQILAEDVLDRVDTDGVVQLTSDLVKVPSITPNETRVSALLAQRLRALGFDVDLYELRGYNDPTRGRCNVVWRIRGTGEGPSLMFNGHLDTEPIPPGYDEIGEDPFSGDIRADGHVYGIGTVNMKGGVAAFVYAMKTLLDEGFKPKGDIIGAAVVAEMEAGLGTRHLIECGVVPDMAIVAEPTTLRIRAAHGCAIDVTLTVKGKPTHMAYPEKGQHVLPKLLELIRALDNFKITYDEAKYKGRLEPRWNIGYIHGGYEFRLGLFLDTCDLGVSVRGPWGVTPESVDRDLKRFLDDLRRQDSDLKVSASLLNPVPRWMPAYDISPDEYLYGAMMRAHNGVTSRDPAIQPPTYGGTDAGTLLHIAQIPTIVFGPGGRAGPFTPPERVGIDELVTATKVFTLAAIDIGSRTWDEVRPSYKVPF